jgi:hypothetical protein
VERTLGMRNVYKTTNRWNHYEYVGAHDRMILKRISTYLRVVMYDTRIVRGTECVQGCG